MTSQSRKIPGPFMVGEVRVDAPCLLAPMSGVTDFPIRRQARRYGAGLVISEMVACETLAQGREDVVRRMAGDASVEPRAIQLAGREPEWMETGAKLAEEAGAQIIDINMGCPARQVTRGLSGSALMRDLDHAMTLVEATVKAVAVPVTLKMRLGWDHGCLNAPELAARAEAAGVKMITVHGRTRQQFYTGQADWAAVAAVREVVSVPLVVNGDIATAANAREALALSGADAVMVGRASQGRPWLPGAIGRALLEGGDEIEPSVSEGAACLKEASADAVALYGEALGVRCMRKHYASFIDWAVADGELAKTWRGRLCRAKTLAEALEGLDDFSGAVPRREAA